jgi:hypothetical protein
VPLLERVEAWIREEGGASVRPGLPVRAAILQVAMAALVRSAALSLRAELWGSADHTERLARVLFLQDAGD